MILSVLTLCVVSCIVGASLACDPHLAIYPPSGSQFSHSPPYLNLIANFAFGTRLVIDAATTELIESATASALQMFFLSNTYPPMQFLVTSQTPVISSVPSSVTRINNTAIAITVPLLSTYHEIQIAVLGSRFLWSGNVTLGTHTVAYYKDSTISTPSTCAQRVAPASSQFDQYYCDDFMSSTVSSLVNATTTVQILNTSLGSESTADKITFEVCKF